MWFNFWSEKSCAVKGRQEYIKGYLREAQSEYNSILIFVITQLYLYIPTIFMIPTKCKMLNDISTFVFLWFDLHLSLNQIHTTVNLNFDNIWCHAQNSCGTSCIFAKTKKLFCCSHRLSEFVLWRQILYKVRSMNCGSVCTFC